MTRFARAFVWIGGAVFVLALVVTAYVYLVRFGDTAPFAGWSPIAFDALLFSIFAGHHSVFAREGAKRMMSSCVPQRLMRSVYVYIASGLLVAACLAWRRVGGAIYHVSDVPFAVLAAVQLAGLSFIVASVRTIDGLDLAGIRQASATNTPLQVGGPYRVVRHPLYLGWMLAVFGTPHLTGDRLVFALISSAYLMVAVPWEERSLEREFGVAYRRYRQRVRWRVLPFLY
jgi:protein-S-isoprenylcysteine O-methyltransferase Ste14